MKKLKVSKEFILDLHKNPTPEKIEKEFPQLFESKLEVGKWYKHNEEDGFLYFISEITNSGFKGYGFCKHVKDFDSDWNISKGSYYGNNMILATESEVETALIAEAEKRGFKDSFFLKDGNYEVIYKDVLRYEMKGNRLCVYGNHTVNGSFYNNSHHFDFIFDNGKWATIIEKPIEMTVAEIEAKLGHSIKIVK